MLERRDLYEASETFLSFLGYSQCLTTCNFGFQRSQFWRLGVLIHLSIVNMDSSIPVSWTKFS